MSRLAALLSAAVMLSGCSVSGALNAVSGSDEVDETLNLAYGPEARHRYDLYTPVDDANAPIVMFVHGGSWEDGSKDIYRFLGTALGEAGYAVAVINYRLSPEVRFPGFVEDAALAADHLLDDGRTVILMGHSAGAHIASLVAYDPRYMAALGRSNCDVAGFIGLAGAYEFLPLARGRFARIFPSEIVEQSQPVNFGRGPTPPSLLLHGLPDRTVHAEDTELMANALRSAGNPVQAEFYEGVGHIEIVGALSRYFRGRAPTYDDVTEWLDARAAAGWPTGC
ncbi:alpha/beta hydrolase [Pontivivens ytuae]|uniref:Alpha/beta hydrolase n=1 Tax=Pontivivens ytuae TaxID=2789856 RepID=A0A7S9LT93_9RHOB|nr:alpha/beta hydrolase [Pontivivens ytuae]QPH54837.1 alpha/beta hydrolase [Pontivivens ytuae]